MSKILSFFRVLILLLLSGRGLLGQEAGALLWRSPLLGSRGAIDACPAMAPDGTLYVTTADAQLAALDPGGREKWSFGVGSDIKSSPAIGDDGTVYFGSRDRRFYAVTPQGKQQWSFPAGAWVDSSPAIAADGTIYFGCWDNKFYALDSAGQKKWEFRTGGPIDSSPAIGADGTIYFGSHDGKFYALGPGGSCKWAFQTGGAIISSPAIGADGTLYITSVDGNLYAVTPGGDKRWQLHTGGVRESSPAIDEQGVICLGVNSCIWAINPDGTRKWNPTGLCIDNGEHNWYFDSSPAVTADGVVVIGGDQGVVVAWDVANNGPRWETMIGGPVKASPSIGLDGTIYIGSDGSRVHAFRGTASLASSSWPKFRGNLRQTGRVSGKQEAAREVQ
jgi:outer membrane protein assembly factor BamB